MRANATVPDISITELGRVDAEQAARLFWSHPWAAERERADALSAQGESGVSPDLTFSDVAARMIVAGEKHGAFKVGISLLRERRILGIFRSAKFYVFEEIPPEKVEELIHVFFQDSLAARHAGVQAARRSPGS